MRVLVLGAGVSGVAAAGLAIRNGDRVTVYAEDPGSGTELLSQGIAFVSGSWSADLLEGIDVVVASPGIPERAQPITESLEAGIPVWSELEYAAQTLKAPVVAVTGTNGKTTVTTLITEMLQTSGTHTVAAGNIGTALSTVADQRWDSVVVEASSFQLRFIEQFHPSVAVVLNVAEDHLDWHGSFAGYLAAKRRITENQSGDDTFVFDMDDAAAASIAADTSARTVGVSGLDAGVDGIGRSGAMFRTGHSSIPVDELAVNDRAYLVDLAAASAAAGAAGASPSAIESVVRQFVPGAHRRTLAGVVDGVRYINDSKGTNPHASLAAIAAYPSVILIAGGRNKGLDLAPLAQSPHVRHLLALGEAADELLAAATVPATRVATLSDAIDAARSIANHDDVVLLSPGCASFDMFTDYQARGDAFTAIVSSIAQEKQAP